MTSLLDLHIMGANSSRYDMVKHRCPNCQTEVWVVMNYELGGWFYIDESGICDICHEEMEIEDD